MDAIFTEIGKLKIVPVVAIQNAGDAAALGEALIAGGLPCAEVTFRTAAAGEAIKTLALRKEILLGAGTVLKVDQVKQAVDCGARFMVSPGFNPNVVGYCVENKIPICPGIANPTDIEMALEFGLEVVKFFPAEAFGGLKTLKAMAAPYGMLKFVPTGGISEKNILDYLRFPKVVACGGSWMVAPELLNEKRFDEITRLTREAVALVKQV